MVPGSWEELPTMYLALPATSTWFSRKGFHVCRLSWQCFPVTFCPWCRPSLQCFRSIGKRWINLGNVCHDEWHGWRSIDSYDAANFWQCWKQNPALLPKNWVILPTTSSVFPATSEMFSSKSDMWLRFFSPCFNLLLSCWPFDANMVVELSEHGIAVVRTSMVAIPAAMPSNRTVTSTSAYTNVVVVWRQFSITTAVFAQLFIFFSISRSHNEQFSSRLPTGSTISKSFA